MGVSPPTKYTCICSRLKPSSARFDILVGLGFGVLWVRHFDEGVREPVEHAKPHDKVADLSLLREGPADGFVGERGDRELTKLERPHECRDPNRAVLRRGVGGAGDELGPKHLPDEHHAEPLEHVVDEVVRVVEDGHSSSGLFIWVHNTRFFRSRNVNLSVYAFYICVAEAGC